MKRAVIVAAAVVVGLTACGAGGKTATVANPDRSAVDALRHQFQLVTDGQFGPEWDELHPAQQAIVSRDTYINCAHEAPNFSFDRLTPKATYREAVTVPGTSVRTESVAVTVEISVGSARSTSTFHVYPAGGGWQWSMSESAIDAYKAGHCPG